MITANNAVWKEWVRHTEEIRAEAAEMIYVKKLKWKNVKKLTDLWIEKEYIRVHPYGI